MTELDPGEECARQRILDACRDAAALVEAALDDDHEAIRVILAHADREYMRVLTGRILRRVSGTP